MQEGLRDWEKGRGSGLEVPMCPPVGLLSKHEQMLREELGETAAGKLWLEMGVTCTCLTLPSFPPVTVADLSFSC